MNPIDSSSLNEKTELKLAYLWVWCTWLPRLSPGPSGTISTLEANRMPRIEPSWSNEMWRTFSTWLLAKILLFRYVCKYDICFWPIDLSIDRSHLLVDSFSSLVTVFSFDGLRTTTISNHMPCFVISCLPYIGRGSQLLWKEQSISVQTNFSVWCTGECRGSPGTSTCDCRIYPQGSLPWICAGALPSRCLEIHNCSALLFDQVRENIHTTLWFRVTFSPMCLHSSLWFHSISSKVGMSLEEGLTTIRRRRPEVQPIPAFYTILQKYEASQQQEIKKNSTTSTTISSQAKPKRPPNQPSIGPAIGPSPPPSKKQKQDTSNKTEESSASAIGPLMPPKVNNQPIIGPIPPPPTETQRNTDRDESERKKTSIGPEMPPSTNQK